MKELAMGLTDSYDVIVMDFRGHGKSKGLFYWTSKEYKDLLAVIGFAKPQYDGIAVIGFSLGGATALITASKTPLIKSMIVVSAPTDFDKIEFRFWELDPKIDLQYSILGEGRIGKGVKPGPWWYKKEKPIECVDKIKAPILYIHGQDDWLIKPWHSEALYKKTYSKKRLVIIKKGPHAEYLIKTHKEETIRAIRDWLKETL